MISRLSWKSLLVVVLLVISFSVPVWAQKPAKEKAVDDYNFAAWLYNQSKHALAVDAYRGFLESHPDHEKAADAQFGLAQSYFYQDHFKEAAGEYEVLRTRFKDFPQMAEALFQLAQCRVALEQFDQADPLFGEVRDRFGSHYLADWALARQAACRISRERFEEAEGMLKDFLGRYAPDKKKVEESEATRDMFRKLEAAGVKAQDAFLSLVERSEFYYAIAQFNRAQYADARGSFERFLSRYRQSPLKDEAQFRLAQSLYQEQAHDKAAAAYAPVAAGTGEFAERAGFERGLALYKAGKLKDAAAVFTDLVTRFPQGTRAAQASLYAGTFLYEAGDYPAASARLKPLAEGKQTPADEAGYWLGMCHLKQNHPAEAEAQFTRSLRDFPDTGRAGDLRLGLGDALLAQGKLPEAAEAFQAFARSAANSDQAPRALYSACVALHRADRYPESDKLCDDFLARYAADALAPAVRFLSGENRFLAKDYNRAGQRYRELLQQDSVVPENVARSHYRLAWVYRHAKDFKAALESLDKVNAADAGKAIAGEVLYLRGVCLLESGKPAEAVEALGQYLKTAEPARYGDDALLKLAAAHVAAGQKAPAIEAYERFLDAYATSEMAPHTRYQLAELYLEARAYDKAIAQHEKILAAPPEGDLAAFARFGLGVCRDAQNRWADAVAAYDALGEHHPASELAAQGLYRKGRSLMKLKRWEPATAAFNALLEKFPKHELSRPSRVSLGYCLQEQKQWSEAAKAFRLAAEQDPKAADQPRVLYEQAWSWREAGDAAASLKAFRTLAQDFPADPLAADANFHLGEAAYAAAVVEGVEKAVQNTQLTEARGYFEKVLASKETKRLGDKARYRVGWIHWLNGKFEEAAPEFDRLTKDFPASELAPDAWFQAGQSYAKSGQSAQAADRYRALVENPKYAKFSLLPEAYIGLADCLVIGGDAQSALKHLDTMTSRFGDHATAADAFFLKGKVQYDLAQYPEALACFDEVFKRSRGEVAARAQFYVGQVHQVKEDLKQALVAYLRVQALYAQHAEWVAASMFESGKCHQGLGAKEDAGKAYRAVVDQFKGTRWAAMATERLNNL